MRPELEEHERVSLSRWRPWMVLYAAVHAGFTVACHCHSFAIRSVFERSLNPHTKKTHKFITLVCHLALSTFLKLQRLFSKSKEDLCN